MSVYEISPCPACGGSEHEALAGQAEVEREVQELWEFHLRRLKPGVPAERLFDRVVFSQAPPLRVVECRRCGLVFRNPRERAEALVEEYAAEEPDREALEGLFRNQLPACRAQARRLARLAGSVNAGLEVGSYLGSFLAAARERGWHFEGLDVNEGAVRFAREMGLAASVGSLEDAPPARRHDVVAIWNTFEQLPDPRRAARAARGLLDPGGLLVLRVPNGAFYARLRRLLGGSLGALARGLLAHNNLLGFPYRHGFSPASLGSLLERSGFEVVSVQGDALVPISDEWTRPWAGREERLVKRLLGALAAVGPAPWFEIYARARPTGAAADGTP